MYLRHDHTVVYPRCMSILVSVEKGQRIFILYYIYLLSSIDNHSLLNVTRAIQIGICTFELVLHLFIYFECGY